MHQIIPVRPTNSSDDENAHRFLKYLIDLLFLTGSTIHANTMNFSENDVDIDGLADFEESSEERFFESSLCGGTPSPDLTGILKHRGEHAFDTSNEIKRADIICTHNEIEMATSHRRPSSRPEEPNAKTKVLEQKW